jgi:ribosomal protein S18 acetylase RimI-like enzyme
MINVRRAVPDDAGAIRRIAESLSYRPPGSEKGFLVHIRSEPEYRRILEISAHSFVAVEENGVVGFLLVDTMPELERIAADVLGNDQVVRYVLGLGDAKAVYADQIGVSLDVRSRGIGQMLAEAMMKEHPGAHFLAAIMHRPARNNASLRLALRNSWTLRMEVTENEFVWGIYELRSG